MKTNRPPRFGYDITFEVDGDEMLICVAADNADEAVAIAREMNAGAGYIDCPVIKIERR